MQKREVSRRRMLEKERRFCEEYLVDLDARAAALRAGYAPGTAERAARWLKSDDPAAKPELIAAVKRLMADKVMEEYARIAFANIGDITDGSKVLEGVGREGTAAVASIKVKGNECDVKMYDKLKALDMLGKHLGMEEDAPESAAMPRIVSYPDGSAAVVDDE